MKASTNPGEGWDSNNKSRKNALIPKHLEMEFTIVKKTKDKTSLLEFLRGGQGKVCNLVLEMS